jgi:hypothetical protein
LLAQALLALLSPAATIGWLWTDPEIAAQHLLAATIELTLTDTAARCIVDRAV